MSGLAIVELPSPFDEARVARMFEALGSDLEGLNDDARCVLAAAAGNAPYLSRLILRERAWLPRLFSEGPQRIVDEAMVAALSAANASDEGNAMALLRGAKRKAALAIALADIAGSWDVERVTRALSLFADASVKGALRFLLRGAAIRAKLPERDGATLEAQTGLVVLAMGKYGAFELNYSSDIDLIVFYEPHRFPFRKRDDARGCCGRYRQRPGQASQRSDCRRLCLPCRSSAAP
ncbi:MAG: hypothetical protein WDM89_18895 [Rhizomicrobium sp.]